MAVKGLIIKLEEENRRKKIRQRPNIFWEKIIACKPTYKLWKFQFYSLQIKKTSEYNYVYSLKLYAKTSLVRSQSSANVEQW